MPGLWKAWKAQRQLPTLSTSPLETSPQAGEIPIFPTLRRRGRMEKWKTKPRFPTSPPPRIYLSKPKTTAARLSLRRPSQQRCAPLAPTTSTTSVTSFSETARAGEIIVVDRKEQLTPDSLSKFNVRTCFRRTRSYPRQRRANALRSGTTPPGWLSPCARLPIP